MALRARTALGQALRRQPRTETPRDPVWLARYGACSLIGGVVLLLASTYAWWLVIGDLGTTLLSGSVAEVVVGIYLIGPFVPGTAFSLLGLLLEVTISPRAEVSRSPA